MAKAPTFSICIPNYNYGHYLAETIQSVLDQTYQEFEIIVADNASTDNSVEVVESFNDPRIKLIRNQYNVGFAPNLQIVTRHANNQFLNLLSADDLMKPSALETYADLLSQQGEKADHTVLMSDADILDSESQVIGKISKSKNSFDSIHQYNQGNPDKPPKNRLNSTQTRHEQFRGMQILEESIKNLRNFAPFLTVVYPKLMWKIVEGYNGVHPISPDKHFNYKLLAQDPEVIYVHKPLFGYRVHGSINQQAQQTTLKQQLDDYLYTLEYSEDFLAELDLSRYDLINSLIDRVCLKTGLTQLVYGTYLHAFRMLAFALAAYPKETLRRPRAYLLAGLLALGPFSKIAARPFYNHYHAKEVQRLSKEISSPL
jgi:glycosyltransferase involved in cell wall biosynthesis